MDDVTLKGLGLYLIAILSSIIALGAFFIGHAVNGIAPEIAVMLGSILGSTEIFIVLIIKHFFKITE